MAMLALGIAGSSACFATEGARSSKKEVRKADKKSATKKAGKKAAKADDPDESEDKAASGRINKSIVSAGSWTDCQSVKKQVSAAILKQSAGKSDSDLLKQFSKPENMLLLAQWVVADAELRSRDEVAKAGKTRSDQLTKSSKELADLEKLIPKGGKLPASAAWNLKKLKERVARLEKESRCSYAFSESAKDENGRKLMEAIADTPEWLNEFAFSGECVRPGMALSILKLIKEKYPDMAGKSMLRKIATATALEYAKSGWNQHDAVERAGFYIKAWKQDRLNAVFDDLPMWERRMVCGCKGDNHYGSISSLTWLLDNVHVPVNQYPGACWRCDYRLNNIYGDSIHGPVYYAPFETVLGENRAQMTQYVGGVCGSLSHFGAFAALANGVPAMTSGEPAHCSYIVKVGDKWTPAYSLSWKRGLHWQVFRNVHTYSSLHAATEMYSEEQQKMTRDSNIWRVLAGVQAEAGDVKAALESYEKSVEAQPRNWMAWREWCELLDKNAASTAAQWNKLNNTMCSALVPIYPELAYDFMSKGMLASMAKKMGADSEQLRKAFLNFWKSVEPMGPDRWNIEDLADKQLNAMGIAKNTDALCKYYTEVLGYTVSNPQYAPAILNWGNNLSSRLDAKGASSLMQATIKGIGSGTGKMTPAERLKLLSAPILAAEKSRDRSAFNAMADMVKATGHKNAGIKMPKFEGFPGKLASEKGLVWTSSTSKWDNPHEHAALLTPEGGTFHTAKDKDAFVAVELARQVYVTGIVVVTSPGNMHRCNNMKIQVSENGTDWKDVHDFGPCKNRVMRTDLGGKKPVARYVRILRVGGPEFFHLNGIYIYGNQAA